MMRTIGVLFFGVLIEALIMLTEGIYYAITMRDKEGRRRHGKGFLYSIMANLFSVVIGSIVFWLVASFFNLH